MTHFSWTNFFLVQTIIIAFIWLLALFIVQTLKKFLQWIQSIWAKNGSFTLNKFFFGKLLKSFSSTYWALWLCRILKKLFQGIQSNEDAHFLGPKWPIFSNDNFFRKPVNEPCFFSSCLSTCQKSKWDINLLMSYWRLKNTEISLAESLFWL